MFSVNLHDKNIHETMIDELINDKSVCAFLWLTDNGREIEFSFKNEKCFASKSNSASYVSLWVNENEQSFTSCEQLFAAAKIGDFLLEQIFEKIDILTVF